MTLGDARLEDCITYKSFLAKPLPRELWCGRRGPAIGSPDWRPFEGPLCARSRRQAITIVRGMYRLLQDQRYLVGNPWSGVAMPRNSDPKMEPVRRLTTAQ